MNILETVDKYFQPHSRSYFLFFLTDQLKNPNRISTLKMEIAIFLVTDESIYSLKLALGAFGDNHIT